MCLRGEFLIFFLPDFYFISVTDITTEFLQKHEIKAILLDIDNTLSQHGSTEPYNGVKNWLDEVRKIGINLAIISNNKEERVRLFAQNLNLDYYISDANKPFKVGFYIAKDLLKVEQKNILVVGDQIFTDILGANLSGMKSVLVEPKDKNEPILIKVKRVVEFPFRFVAKMKYKKR